MNKYNFFLLYRFLSSFDRPNLKYEVRNLSGKAALLEVLGLLKTRYIF